MRITTDNGRKISTGRYPAYDPAKRPTEGEDQPYSRIPRFWLSLLSGVLTVACFPGINLSLLVWVACTPLLIAVVTESSLIRAFALGYLSGAVFLGGSCYWFVIVMKHYGGLNTPLALGVLILFVLVFSVIFGLFGLAEAWIAAHSRAMALVAGPFVWVSLELLRTYYVTGFPWNLLGYAVSGTGLRQLASVTGVYGLTFLAVSTSSLVAAAILLWRDRGFTPDRVALRTWATPTLWFALLLFTNHTSKPPLLPPGTNEFHLLQPDVPLDDADLQHWVPANDPRPLNHLIGLSVAAACSSSKSVVTSDQRAGCADLGSRSETAAGLIVWAENPAPFLFSRDAVFRNAVTDLARRTHSYVVFNTVNFKEPQNAPLNSAMVLDPSDGVVMQYDKIHLVPFGEYVPSWAFPGKVGKIVSEVGDFVPGTVYRSAKTPDGSIAVPICYEDIFPQLVRRLVPNGPGVLVSISNDAWYGDSAARYQHLQMAALRAIENGRYLLRATNDGVTTAIDPYGRIVQELPLHEAAVLSGRFSYLSQRTFYGAHGDVFAWLCVAVTLAVFGVTIRPRSRAEI